MTPHDLLANFEVLAEAPNGIQRLRELVLELAVRGKLVEQDPGDEPIQEVLKRILGQQRAQKRPEGAFDLPASWAWVSGEEAFGFITSGSRGWAQYYAADGPIFLRIGNLDYGTTALDLRDIQRVNPPSGAEGQRTATRPGDVLVSITGDTGMIGLVPKGFDTAYINQHIALCRPAVTIWAPYLATVLLAPFAQDQFRAGERGIKKSLGLGDIRGLQLPIPPEAEQHRIVARVDELMALLDRLEAKRQDREAARTAARDSALAALREAPTPDDVETAWLRIQERFHELFAAPEDVEPLRHALLQLAVQGRLLPQLPEEPSGASLLEEVKLAKAKAGHVGRRRPSGTSSETPLVESSTMLPHGWARTRLGDILWECRNGLSKTPNDSGEGFKLLRISAATANPKWVVNCLDHRWVNVSAEEAEQYRVHTGDLLSCRFNGNLHFVGKVAQVPVIEQETYLYPDKLIRLRPILVNPRFLCLAINAGPSRSQIESFAATTAGNIGINGTQLQSIVVPIPPLPEQVRIVARVDDLMTLLDRLSESLAYHKEIGTMFAAAAVHHLEV